MFAVSEAESVAIRTAFEQGGEPSAAFELRRLFPGIESMAGARECARIIAGWAPYPAPAPGDSDAAQAEALSGPAAQLQRSAPTLTNAQRRHNERGGCVLDTSIFFPDDEPASGEPEG